LKKCADEFVALEVYLHDRNSIRELTMLKAMSRDWDYPVRNILRLSVRLLYTLYKMGKIVRRYPKVLTRRSTRTTRILEFLVKMKRRNQWPEPEQ
jgi:hypothetical protein